jgi:hypothetical protein
MFIKEAPILDPFKLLTGELTKQFDLITNLPDFIGTNQVIPKIVNPYNSAYVDGLFNFINGLLGEIGFIHGVEFYGSYLAIKKNYTFNITDDLDYLVHSKYFRQNTDKLYTISRNLFDNPKINITPHPVEYEPATFDDIIDITDITDITESIPTESIPTESIPKESIPTESIPKESIPKESIPKESIPTESIPKESIPTESVEYSKKYDEEYLLEPEEELSKGDSDIDSISTISDNESEHDEDLISISQMLDNTVSLKSETDVEDIDDTSNDESSHSDESDNSSYITTDSEPEDIFACIPLFPVHLICIEKCKDTLDSLLIGNELNEDELFSCMIQILMILITYQQSFDFTHNDLHTNNIVFVDTNKKFILYTYNNTRYKVPTYGKIYKIIDFGRSIYSINGQLVCGDSYNKKEDAYSQYNFGPCYNPNHPIVEPNYSFDLCRLACSMIDIFIPDYETATCLTPFSKLLLKLCSDDNGKYVLYKKTNEERYPNFKLYKMIARTVHAHTPENVLGLDHFQKYKCKEKSTALSKNTIYINIDQVIHKIKNWEDR